MSYYLTQEWMRYLIGLPAELVITSVTVFNEVEIVLHGTGSIGTTIFAGQSSRTKFTHQLAVRMVQTTSSLMYLEVVVESATRYSFAKRIRDDVSTTSSLVA